MEAVLAWAAMGGYAPFVWSAYGDALVLLGGLVAASLRGHARARAEAERLEAIAPRRRAAAAHATAPDAGSRRATEAAP